MAAVASVGATSSGVSSAQFQAEYSARVLSLQKDVQTTLGAAAIKLIQAAITTDPSVGQNLDVFA